MTHTPVHMKAYLEYRTREVLSYKLFNRLHLSSHSDLESVAMAVGGLELLRRAQTVELSIDHDGHSGAESLTLCHAVSGEHHRLTPAH